MKKEGDPLQKKKKSKHGGIKGQKKKKRSEKERRIQGWPQCTLAPWRSETVVPLITWVARSGEEEEETCDLPGQIA